MRWLIVHPGPNFSVSDVYEGWREALNEAGEQVQTYCLDRRLTFFDSALVETGEYDEEGRPQVRKFVTRDQAIELATEGLLGACYRCWPDVILFVSAMFTGPHIMEILRERGHKIVMLFTEGPYQTGMQLKMAEYASVCLLNDPCDIDRYTRVAPSIYMPHAYRPSLHSPGAAISQLECDLAFVGTGFPSRVDFFEAMDLEGLDVMLCGNWAALVHRESPLLPLLAHDVDDCLDNAQTVQVYRSARSGINVYRRESEPEQEGVEAWAMGPREVEMAAAGLFFLRDPRGEGDDVLGMLPTFDSPGDASEKLRWWLDHPGMKDERARQARAAIAGRTFAANAQRLIREIARLPRTMHLGS